MSAQRLRVPANSRPLNITLLGEDYFQDSIFINKAEKLTSIEEMSEVLLMPTMFCSIDNQTHYLATVDLFMTASFEMEHRKEIVEKEILERLKKTDNFLDIGIGKGDLTKFIGQHFSNITVIDNNLESLSSLPNRLGTKNAIVTKIQESILNVTIPQHQYDLIVLSHTLYYIEDNYRKPLFDKLYSGLNNDGILLVVYNDGRGRNQLVKKFGGRVDDFDDFFFSVMSSYENAYALTSIEIMESKAIEPMLHIANLIIFDASAKAGYKELAEYIEFELHNGYEVDSIYQLDMKQNFIFVGVPPDVYDK